MERGKKYILIVDDEPHLILAAEEACKDMGYETLIAPDLETVVRLSHEAKDAGAEIILAVTDMEFGAFFGVAPGKQVPYILEQVFGHRYPVIVQSGTYLKDGEADGQKILEDDRFAGYIAKPWSIPALEAEVQRVLKAAYGHPALKEEHQGLRQTTLDQGEILAHPKKLIA